MIDRIACPGPLCAVDAVVVLDSHHAWSLLPVMQVVRKVVQQDSFFLDVVAFWFPVWYEYIR